MRASSGSSTSGRRASRGSDSIVTSSARSSRSCSPVVPMRHHPTVKAGTSCTTSCGRRARVAALALERPQIDKLEGDIPFELGVEDIVVGDGDEATKGSKVAVHYVGVAFSTGDEFDASWNRGDPFKFKLGAGNVIPGWDAGVVGMKVGGRRKLTIPSAMAYGARGAGGVIKPHEPLVFVVDLLSVD